MEPCVPNTKMNALWAVPLAAISILSAAFAQRDPCVRPFDRYSLWNMPIHHDAHYKHANMTPANRVKLEDVQIMRIAADDPFAEIWFSPWSDRCPSGGYDLGSTIRFPHQCRLSLAHHDHVDRQRRLGRAHLFARTECN